MNIISIKVSESVFSKTNTEGREKGKAFDDLVSSVKEKGVLIPVIVRKVGKKYEVIAGNRRLAAAKKCGLKTIPASLVEVDDTEAQEIQIVENLQREDIHPIDEGQLYRKLVEESKLEVKVIAAKVGKSDRYIKERLFLTNLGEKAAAAYRNGNLNDGHAVLIAKLAVSDQELAVKFIEDECYEGYTPPVKDLKEWIMDEIESDLENQPWLKSEEAKKAAGKCDDACGVITAVQSLFGPVKQGACTSLKCWRRKMDAYINWRCHTDNLSRVSGSYGKSKTGVVSMDDFVIVQKSGKSRCQSVIKAIIVDGKRSGEEVEICADPKCEKHRKMKSGYQLSPEEMAARKEERKKEREAAAKKLADHDARIKTVIGKVDLEIPEKYLNALVALAIGVCPHDAMCSIARRNGFDIPRGNKYDPKYRDYSKAMTNAAKEMEPKDKSKFLFELMLHEWGDNISSLEELI